jgi:hypothetical protein
MVMSTCPNRSTQNEAGNPGWVGRPGGGGCVLSCLTARLLAKGSSSCLPGERSDRRAGGLGAWGLEEGLPQYASYGYRQGAVLVAGTLQWCSLQSAACATTVNSGKLWERRGEGRAAKQLPGVGGQPSSSRALAQHSHQSAPAYTFQY